MDREISFSSGIEPTVKRPIVLLVDDDEDNLLMMSLALELWNYGFLTAAEGEAAVELAQSYIPDLILLDIILPDFNGVEVVQRLKGNHQTKKIPIVVLTALPKEQYREDMLKAGCSNYVTKPCTLEQLEKVINENINVNFVC